MANPYDEISGPQTQVENLGTQVDSYSSSGMSGIVDKAMSATGNFFGSSFLPGSPLMDTVTGLAAGVAGSLVTDGVSSLISNINGTATSDRTSPFSNSPGSMVNVSNGAVPGSQVGSSFAGGVAHGVWNSVQYASDMINVAPKYKFLFKVLFSFNGGGGPRDFYYFVKTIDKPKISFIYEDVNFYNYRTKVLTKTTHEPLSMTFWDDQTNSVFNFFHSYRNRVSPISNWANVMAAEEAGMAGIKGSGSSFSDRPVLSSIKLQQLFLNGTQSNVFTFVNPRIENFDFDGCDHEDSQYNVMTCQFNYDNLYTETVGQATLYDWGMLDMLHGGGAGGIAGGGAGGLGGVQQQQSLTGNSIGNGMATVAASPFMSTLKNVGIGIGAGLLGGIAAGGVGKVIASSTSILSTQLGGTMSKMTNSLSGLFASDNTPKTDTTTTSFASQPTMPPDPNQSGSDPTTAAECGGWS